MKRRLLLALPFVVLLCGIALARPGGGESYSGGGGDGGGGGGGGGGILDVIELIIWIIDMCIEYPYAALTIIIVIVVWGIYSHYQEGGATDWDSHSKPLELKPTSDLMDLRALDPDFSPIVFEDFAFRLFSTAHRARGSLESLASVGPYVSASARQSLADREPKGVPVEQVIVGAMRVVDATIPQNPTDDTEVTIRLEFEANVLTKSATYYSVERWELARGATTHSKPPGAAKTFPCPNCGAPWQATRTGTQVCESCHQVVDNGRFDWVVKTIALVSQTEEPPTLTTEVHERTSLVTWGQSDVDQRASAMNLDVDALKARLDLIYRELNAAWSQNDLTSVRGYVSDGLFDYLQYWVEAYKRQGLRNQLADMRITQAQLSKITNDRWYDAVTIRIGATGKDYVVHEPSGKVVRGSRSRERPYSEYWTLIRSAGRQGSARADKTCGNCGAPLDVTMAGACAHCGAHVTAGEFDWVLSKIEQDDSYRG